MQKQEAVNELLKYILLTEKDSYINNPRRLEKINKKMPKHRKTY